MSDDWAKENGREVLWYAENPVTKRVFFTSPFSPLPVGYNRCSTSNPRQMDRIFNRMHEQEREHNQKLIEKIWLRGRENFDALRSALRTRLNSSGVSEAEKGIIRASLQLMDEKDSKSQENHVFGVSAIQEHDEYGQKVKDEEDKHEREMVN